MHDTKRAKTKVKSSIKVKQGILTLKLLYTIEDKNCCLVVELWWNV